ncbi:hypothetical protein [Oleidesulfovibrio sp.]|uniref:hypothetical protein n=1 Tax=Oleidesulfovibrio sp. TaxID=2909707 RepID=UPI003A8B0D11
MQITFTHKKKKPEASVSGPSEVKLYAVPTSYSDDGYYLAAWSSGDYEPVPSCAVNDAELLAHLAVEGNDQGELAMREIFCAQGVKYAAN